MDTMQNVLENMKKCGQKYFEVCGGIVYFTDKSISLRTKANVTNIVWSHWQAFQSYTSDIIVSYLSEGKAIFKTPSKTKWYTCNFLSTKQS